MCRVKNGRQNYHQNIALKKVNKLKLLPLPIHKKVMTEVYKPKHKLRFVTAAALFDGHDATINIKRRILQSSGAEVIH